MCLKSARIEELSQELKAKFDIDAQRLMLELARVGLSDPRSLFDASGRLIPIHQLPEDAAAAISSIKVRQVRVGDNVEESIAEIKFWNKNVALEALCKIQGLFNVDNGQKPTSELTDLLEEISRNSTRCLPCDDKRRRG